MLTDNHVTDDELILFFQTGGSFSGLVEVNLSDNVIGCRGMEVIAFCIACS